MARVLAPAFFGTDCVAKDNIIYPRANGCGGLYNIFINFFSVFFFFGVLLFRFLSYIYALLLVCHRSPICMYSEIIIHRVAASPGSPADPPQANYQVNTVAYKPSARPEPRKAHASFIVNGPPSPVGTLFFFSVDRLCKQHIKNTLSLSPRQTLQLDRKPLPCIKYR